MNPDDFRRHGHALVDWIADYFEQVERYPVLARVKPGDITGALPDIAPEDGEPFETIMADFERVLVPGLTHWNHPGFLAYVAGRDGARSRHARMAAKTARVARQLRGRHLRHGVN